MTKKLIVLGTGGNCIDILDVLDAINDRCGERKYECVGFLDDNAHKWGQCIAGVPVLGPLTLAPDYPECFFVNGIGSVNTFVKKREIIARAGVSLDRFETVVHPSASVSRLSSLGHGVVVFQHVTVASKARVGDHVIVLPHSVISHDAVIGDYTCIASGVCISGLVRVGHSCYLGTGSAIRERVQIGDCCLVGMGSVVLDDVPDGAVVVGNPARFLRQVGDVAAEGSF